MFPPLIDSKPIPCPCVLILAHVHDLRSTVWIYLFFLPFQLVDLFGYYTIPGVGIAAFIYLGLIAAGEEIEQPFGMQPPCRPMFLPLICTFSRLR